MSFSEVVVVAAATATRRSFAFASAMASAPVRINVRERLDAVRPLSGLLGFISFNPIPISDLVGGCYGWQVLVLVAVALDK